MAGKLKVEYIELEDNKMLDAVFGYIFDCSIAEVTVSDSIFLDTNEHNGRGHCKYSICYCWGSVPDTIAASQIQINYLVANTEPSD